MTLLNRRTRSALALTAVAALAPLAAVSSANAAPVRTAATSTYSSALYLQDALGLPASETNPAIKSVTYDRFQWILQQEGKYAVLIGDPATDPTFKARAQDVETAADAAGVKDVFWFNPNLSGNAKVSNSITEPALDIRDTAGINLTAASVKIIDQTWKNLIAQYLGNGVKNPTTTTPTLDATNVNDYGSADGFSTEVGNVNGGALYNYTTNAGPDDVKESYFLVYNKDRTVPVGGSDKPSKIAAWVDLTDETTSTTTKSKVTTAFASVGAANISASSEFSWWKSANNAKNDASATASTGKGVPVLTDDDAKPADGGWRVHQVSYPELIFFLKTENTKEAAILFGGTWCPNTRPVIQAVNREAQKNDVTVINFDTILDGGQFGGGNSGSNPLQSRGTRGTAAADGKSVVPSYLYGDFLDQYLTNIKTQYLTSNNGIKYFPGGDSTKTEVTTKKLQVPFVIGYKGKAGDAPNGGVTRQWIIDKGNDTYTEYMSVYQFTRPLPNQLGLAIPLDAPIWAKINAQLANFTWQSDPTPNLVNTAIDTDDADFLVAGDTATVTPSGSPVSNVGVTVGGPTSVSPAALSAALTALGGDAPVNLAAAKAALITALNASPQDATKVANLTTVYGAWYVANTSRKTKVNQAWGNATTPASIAGGLAAVHQLEVFFAGRPGGVISTQTVTADSVDSATAATVSIAIANDFGRKPAGNVALTVKQGGTTVASATAAVAGDKASFTLPVLAAGSYDLSFSYVGDDQIASFTKSGSLTVTQAPAGDTGNKTQADAKPADTKPTPTTTVVKVKASKLAGAVAKAPTSKKPGKYSVKITAPSGKAAATGKVTLTLKKGKTKKVLTGTVKNGVLTVTVPKLAKGTWKVTISFAGDVNYLAEKVAGAAIKVKK